MTIEFDYGVPDDPEQLKLWLALQTPEVQEAAKSWPIGQPFSIRDQLFWVVGYTPEGDLVCIKRDPATLTLSEFQRLVESGADVLDARALLDIVTRN